MLIPEKEWYWWRCRSNRTIPLYHATSAVVTNVDDRGTEIVPADEAYGFED